MTKQERNERIDNATHGSLPRAFYSVIDELLDQGYEWPDIQKYLQSRYSEALTYLHNEAKGGEGSRQHYLQKDAEQKHWEDLATHNERFTDED
jgi:hypothetical protein